MNKIKYLIFSMLCTITSIIYVSAKENVVYEWGEYYANNIYTIQKEVIQKEDSYYIIGTNDRNGTLTSKKYDAKTGELKSSFAESRYCYDGIYAYENTIICSNNDVLYFFDETLTEEKKLNLNDSGVYLYENIRVTKFTEEELILWDVECWCINKINLNTGESHWYDMDEIDNHQEWLGDYYTFYNVTEGVWEDNKYFYYFQEIGNKYVLGYEKSTSENDYYNNIVAYDSTGKQLFDITLSNEMYWNYLALEDRVLVIELVPELTSQECRNSTEDTCSSKATLKVYDYEGNLTGTYNLQDKLTSEKYNFYYNGGHTVESIVDTKDGFLVLYNFPYIEEQSLEETIEYYPAAVKYHFTYDIETKTDGNGTVEAIQSSKSGETVTFKVTPKEGYTIDVIKVTDKDGNVITITEETFTMPSADVLIEATFKKSIINPNTSAFHIILWIILIPLSIGFGLLSIKKLSWLK